MKPPLPPSTIIASRYELLSLLGTGGMARVYRARHRLLDRQVALKLLPSDELDTGEQRFLREARNAALLDHPGCIRVHDYGATDDGNRFIVMELIDGPTLLQELERAGAMPPRRALGLICELLDALAHAHSRGVLHRDIKPANVMRAHDGGGSRVVLIDFGLSRLHDDAPLTLAGSCVGSPSYLAPERLLRQPYDARADLYGVGVLLYELLAGRRPFTAQTPLELARQHVSQMPQPLDEVRPGLPAALVALVHRALAKHPEARHESAYEMLAAAHRIERSLHEPGCTRLNRTAVTFDEASSP